MGLHRSASSLGILTMATTEELETRLAALETRLAPAPLAANPPITIGELTDVPAPGSAIASQWAQEVSARVLQRFANNAALQAWAAPDGAQAIDLATARTYVRKGGAWIADGLQAQGMLVWRQGALSSGAIGNVDTGIVELTFGFTVPGNENRCVGIHCSLSVIKTGGSAADLVWARVRIPGPAVNAQALVTLGINQFGTIAFSGVTNLAPGANSFNTYLQAGAGTIALSSSSITTVAVYDLGPQKAAI